jgi:hypothetical protein
LSKVVVLSIEMMSCDRAIVRSPPLTGADEPLEDDALDVPLPHAARVTAATVARAVIPADLTRVERVIDCLIVRPADGGRGGVLRLVPATALRGVRCGSVHPGNGST